MKKYLFLLLVGLGFSSCASLSGFEEGRVIGKNNHEVGASVNYFTYLDGFDDVTGALESSLHLPTFEFTYKYGVSENMDVWGKASILGNFGIYTKYQVVGDRNSKFALSPGLGVSSSIGFFTFVEIPVYMSIHPTDKLSINITPKYIYASPFIDEFGYSRIGANFGILFGSRHKFGIDVSYFSVVAEGDDNFIFFDRALFNYGIGGKFRFGENTSSSGSSKRRKW